MRKILITGILLIAAVIAVVVLRPTNPEHQSDTDKNDSYEYYYNKNENNEEDNLLPEDINSILTDNQTVPLDTIPSSKTVLVNRKYLLPSNYIPSNLVVPNVKFSFSYLSDKRKLRKVAAVALEKLFAAGDKDGIELYGVSGYRSYARQKEIYDKNVATRGKDATDSVSAMPGSSEHQSGLSIDVSAKSVSYRLDQSLGDTKEGKWLAKNAHNYGFIIRYPYGKSKITGYSYEPWHIRFVGKAVATYLYKNDLTLEEYYGVQSSEKDEPDTGVDVEDPDSVKYATPRPTKKPKATSKPKVTEKAKHDSDQDKSSKPKKSPTQTKKPAENKKPAVTLKPTEAPVVNTPEPTPVPDQPSASDNSGNGTSS